MHLQVKKLNLYILVMPPDEILDQVLIIIPSDKEKLPTAPGSNFLKNLFLPVEKGWGETMNTL